MKTYEEQRYPVSIKVKVAYHGHVFTDHIKGLNPGHALYLARLNWPGAETVTQTERGA